jgi:hypothetical protein
MLAMGRAVTNLSTSESHLANSAEILNMILTASRLAVRSVACKSLPPKGRLHEGNIECLAIQAPSGHGRSSRPQSRARETFAMQHSGVQETLERRW